MKSELPQRNSIYAIDNELSDFKVSFSRDETYTNVRDDIFRNAIA